jgi:hypothetical protein
MAIAARTCIRTLLPVFPKVAPRRISKSYWHSWTGFSNVSDSTVNSTCGPIRNEITERNSLDDPRLGRYSTAERRAVFDHRFFLSIDLKREASVEESLQSWESGVCVPWRREKMRRDRHAQVKEIERHKYFLSMQIGYDVGWEPAALDWVQKYAAAWREWWEHHWWERHWWE